MKYKEKQEAIKLRKEKGLSIGDISKELGVSKSSVSLWVRDIELTSEQHEKLRQQNPIYNQQLNGQATMKKNAFIKRKGYQEEGKSKAKENNLLHLKGCMLYWAEGGKKRKSLEFVNSDANMMKLFIKFLRECYFVSNDLITISINCYDDLHSVTEIEHYWIEQLNLQKSSLRKTYVNNKPKSSKNPNVNKLEYGVCTIRVYRTEIVQNIFGAIKEYAGFNNDDWLN